MLSRLINKTRSGENKDNTRRARTDRFVEENGYWFFRTREGYDVGPFENRSDAEYALLYFAEQADWPTEKQLNTFIEGCQLNAGVAHS